MSNFSQHFKYKNLEGIDKLQAVSTSLLFKEVIEHENLEEIKSFLASGYISEEDLSSALAMASAKGHLDIVKSFVASGYISEEDLSSALAMASAKGHLDIVKFLLESGAPVDKEVSRGIIKQTPLYLATMRGHTDIAQLLINRGANVNFSMSNGDRKNISSVLETATFYRHPKIVKALVDAGALVNIRSKHGSRTPIHIAARNGDLEIVQALIDGNADLDLKDEIGSTPLHEAISNSNLEVTRVLLEEGANPNISNNFMNFPIKTAILHGITSIDTKSILELLLDKGANPIQVMIPYDELTNNYIRYRIISKRMITKESIKKWNCKGHIFNLIQRYKYASNILDSFILRAIKENLITEEQAKEFGFIERYNEVLEKRVLLEKCIENMRIIAENNEENRIKNTNMKRRNFGTYDLAQYIENFLVQKDNTRFNNFIKDSFAFLENYL